MLAKQSNVRPAIRLAVTLAVAVAILAYCSSQRLDPDVTRVLAARSADGNLEARLEFVVYVGHLTGDPARHEIYIGRVGQRDSEATLAFAADWPHDGYYRLDWVGSRTLRVTLSPHARIEVRESSVGAVNVEYKML
jgi:hypothetical protein